MKSFMMIPVMVTLTILSSTASTSSPAVPAQPSVPTSPSKVTDLVPLDTKTPDTSSDNASATTSGNHDDAKIPDTTVPSPDNASPASPPTDGPKDGGKTATATVPENHDHANDSTTTAASVNDVSPTSTPPVPGSDEYLQSLTAKIEALGKKVDDLTGRLAAVEATLNTQHSVAPASAAADSGISTTTSSASVIPSSAPASSSADAYGQALVAIKNKDFATAEKQLRDFIHDKPNDEKTSNAYYLLGDVLFLQQKNKEAESILVKGYRQFGNRPEAPKMLLKLAHIEEKLGKKQDAKVFAQSLLKKYPMASDTIKKDAQKILDRLNQ